MARTRTDLRSEKQVEHAGDVFMGTLGFTIVRFSQSRATQQSPGIPDRRYYRQTSHTGSQSVLNASPRHDRPGARGLALWWEAKREGGVQSPAQRAFQLMAESAGELYVLGTDAALHEWAAQAGLVERLPNGFRRL